MTSPVYVPKPKSPRRRRSSLKRQRLALLVCLAAVIVLAVAFAIVYHFTSRTVFKDTDGTKYYILEVDGIYVMQDADGNTLPTTADTNNYSTVYKTPLGTLVELDPTTGKHAVIAIVATSGTEALEYSSYSDAYDILLYPMLERADIHSIRVHNEKGDFAFLQTRVCTNADCAYADYCEKFTEGTRNCPKCGAASSYNSFVIEGFPNTAYDANMFATLVVVTGYTSTYMRLDFAEVTEYAMKQYGDSGESADVIVNRFMKSEYGLDQSLEVAERYFTITDIYGRSHSVLLGDEITAGTGYYARYVGRDEVYILKELEDTEYSTTLSGVAFAPIEDYVTPTVTDTMSNTDYVDMTDFKLNTVHLPDEIFGNEEPDLSSVLSNIITFSYSPIEKRQGSFYSNIPYIGGGAYAGFNINSYRVDDCLQNLQAMTGIRTVKLLSDKENEEGEMYFLYFLSKQDTKMTIAYCMEYTHNLKRDKDYKVTESEKQQIWISDMTKDGTYYVYNARYQMIIEVSRSYLEYLEWDAFMWIETEVFTGNIVYLDKMEITIPGGTTQGQTGITHVLFDIENAESLEGWDKASSSTIPTNKMMAWASFGGNAPITVDLMQFKRFYQTLLYSSLSGTATCPEEQQQAFRDAALSEGYTTSAATPCLVIKVTFNTEADGSGETIVRTYCFYSYGGGRQCFMTLNGNGSFYMLQARVNKIISDVGRVFTPETVIKPQDKT